MGDRALIQLKVDDQYSPVLYLHSGGSLVHDLIGESRRVMLSRGVDLYYHFARLVQIAGNDTPGNLSVGVWNAPDGLTLDDSHDDAGCFVVDLDRLMVREAVVSIPECVETFGGYGFNV